MKKWIWQIVLFLVIVAIMASCSRDIYSKTYTIERVNGKLIEFKGVNNYYVTNCDTFKVGDKVKLRRTFRQSKATIW